METPFHSILDMHKCTAKLTVLLIFVQAAIDEKLQNRDYVSAILRNRRPDLLNLVSMSAAPASRDLVKEIQECLSPFSLPLRAESYSR